MAKNRDSQKNDQEEMTVSRPVPVKKEAVKINSQNPIWFNFDQCWAVCVKNGTPGMKEAAKAHLKSIGHWDDQTMWISGLKHFGIPLEK